MVTIGVAGATMPAPLKFLLGNEQPANAIHALLVALSPEKRVGNLGLRSPGSQRDKFENVVRNCH